MRVDASKKGLPRPILDGLPAPYSGQDDQHGVPQWQRYEECLRSDVCAVCGEGFGENEKRYVAAYADQTNLLDDGQLMHERCAKLALAHCPHMRHGFSRVFWVMPDEISLNNMSRRLISGVVGKIEERRITLRSTAEDPDLVQPWRPPNEEWPSSEEAA